MPLSAGQLMEYAEKRAMQAAFGVAVAAWTQVGGYLALLTAAPAAGTDLTMAAETEYGATGYARQAFGTGVAPTSASPSVISNPGVLTWGPMTSSPGTSITWAMLCDTSSGTASNVAVSFLVSTPRTPISGDSVQAAAAAFTGQV